MTEFSFLGERSL